MGVWGMGCKTSSSIYEQKPATAIIPGNPNPKNYKIEKVTKINNLTIVQINYPDCKNYEGNKILVLEGVSSEDLMNARIIDPHFTNAKAATMVPIARFPPNARGLEMAKAFCNAWQLTINNNADLLNPHTVRSNSIHSPNCDRVISHGIRTCDCGTDG